MSDRFEWEAIEDFERITGIEPVDKALAYDDPTGLLLEHFARRERHDGKAAVIEELRSIVASTPRDSAVGRGVADWLRRYEHGSSLHDLRS